MSDCREWHDKSDWVMADDALIEHTMGMLTPSAQRRWLRWNCLPSTEQRRGIEALRVRVWNPSGSCTPPLIRELTGLEYLSMPLHYASALCADWLPPSIETLCFDEDRTAKKKDRVRMETVLPSVRHVKCISGTLSFTRAGPPRSGTGFYRERNFSTHVTPAVNRLIPTLTASLYNR
jgi:hypothetical protein